MTHTQVNERIRSELEEKTIANLDIILSSLHIDYNDTGPRYFFPCPIHPSDNYNSMSLYKDTGIAVCFTRGCMSNSGEGFGIFKFVSAVLKVGEKEAKQFCSDVLSGLSIDVLNRVPVKRIEKEVKEIDRDDIPKSDGNIDFYLKRGYTKETIKKYDIFICKKKGHTLFGRVTIPVYNDDHTKALGFLGRSLFPKCPLCKKYHSPLRSCPVLPFEIMLAEKWLNSKGMGRNKLLFNYWFAKDVIRETGEVILVESPGNCMKIVQAGVQNVVGIFGTALSRKQIEKLDQSGIRRLYLGLDQDSAGMVALAKIQEQLAHYECIPLIPPMNDYGDMTDQQILDFLSSQNFNFKVN